MKSKINHCVKQVKNFAWLLLLSSMSSSAFAELPKLPKFLADMGPMEALIHMVGAVLLLALIVVSGRVLFMCFKTYRSHT